MPGKNVFMMIPEPPPEERLCYKCGRKNPEAVLRGRLENKGWIYLCRWHRSGDNRHRNWVQRKEKESRSLERRFANFLRKIIPWLDRRKVRN
jgi:hypothetical protein